MAKGGAQQQGQRCQHHPVHGGHESRAGHVAGHCYLHRPDQAHELAPVTNRGGAAGGAEQARSIEHGRTNNDGDLEQPRGAAHDHFHQTGGGGGVGQLVGQISQRGS